MRKAGWLLGYTRTSKTTFWRFFSRGLRGAGAVWGVVGGNGVNVPWQSSRIASMEFAEMIKVFGKYVRYILYFTHCNP